VNVNRRPTRQGARTTHAEIGAAVDDGARTLIDGNPDLKGHHLRQLRRERRALLEAARRDLGGRVHESDQWILLQHGSTMVGGEFDGYRLARQEMGEGG